MYLKSLNIHGFKSFADRTLFEFAEGVTGIVGPNGCGKSNVVDAIRWVLGETSAKALRGGEMADVIFNGTEKRKPLGMAEVTLTMAGCGDTLKLGFDEVAVTRRVFRDGRSEYRINGTLCRLKDIHEMFMDTGIGRTAYSIMAQGQIDQILSSKPEERRAVFEEAAGITKFKREKKEALRKLEYTEANLLRVSDVLAEQERRMNSLKRQVAKARRYQALAADTRVLDTHLSHRKFVELSAAHAELLASMRSLAKAEEVVAAKLPAHEADVAEARAAARVFEGELAALRQQLNDHLNAIAGAEGRIAFNDERAAELKARTAQNEQDILENRDKLAQQEFDFSAAGRMLEQLHRQIADKEERLAVDEQRAAESREERQRIESTLNEHRSEANRTQTLIAAIQAKIEGSLAQLDGSRERNRQLADEEQRLDLEIASFRSEQERLQSEVADTSSALIDLEESFQRAERAWQHSRGDLDAARAAAVESHKHLAQRSARLDAVAQLVESGEGFEKGTQSVLQGLGDPDRFKPTIHGALASFIEVDNTCARAIEAALGPQLQAVLVSDQAAAEAVIGHLTSQRLGVAAVMPESWISRAQPSQIEALPDGAVAWALDRVKADPRVAGVIDRLLERVLIVPDLAVALRLRGQHGGVTFVTIDGVLLGAEGAIRGGAAADGSASVLGLRNEARALEDEVARLREDDERARLRVEELESRLEKQREEMEVARERLQRGRVDLSTLQGQLILATREVENFETKIENVRWERGELERRARASEESREQMESELAAARARLESIEQETRRLQTESGAASQRDQELAAALDELRIELAVERRAKQAAEEQQRPMEARLAELRAITGRREAEITSFRERIEAAADENRVLIEQCAGRRADAAALESTINSRESNRAGILEAIETAEIALAALRRDQAKILEQKGREEVEATKFELRIENLVNTVQERYQVDLASFEPDAHALLASIQSQKSLQARSGRQTVVAADESADDPDDDIPTMVVDGTGDADAADVTASSDDGPDWDFVEAIVNDIRRRLDAMGPVNLDAIDEYEELEERHNFLRGQHDDLTSSKTELLAVIERINTETQRLFSETFAQVRLNFQSMFKELFGDKGQADLTLIDEGDPLESGIEVIAKPPGKKLQSITLLSGGERSMTAVALLFSIYMIKPSPFCVLDELDAPLDESNIGRFVRVLDRFIDRSQFIIVTHSKRTMARADVMYGVTMEEFGVSKPVGMRLTQAAETAVS
jgi:chromosome segregation protein